MENLVEIVSTNYVCHHICPRVSESYPGMKTECFKM